jgi:hypothetical protein
MSLNIEELANRCRNCGLLVCDCEIQIRRYNNFWRKVYFRILQFDFSKLLSFLILLAGFLIFLTISLTLINNLAEIFLNTTTQDNITGLIILGFIYLYLIKFLLEFSYNLLFSMKNFLLRA